MSDSEIQKLLSDLETIPPFVRFRTYLGISTPQAINYALRAYFSEKEAAILEGLPIISADIPLDDAGAPMLNHEGYQYMIEDVRQRLRLFNCLCCEED